MVKVMNWLAAVRGAPRRIRADNVLRHKSRSAREQRTPMACGASSFEKTESWQSPASLRLGAPSRVRSEASPAPPPLTDSVASAAGQLSGSSSSRGNRQLTVQLANPGGFHVSDKALTIINI